MIFLLGALKILAQAPEPARSATALAPDVPVAAAEAVGAIAPEAAPPQAPAETVTSQGGIRFAVRQVEPSYTVVAGDSLSSIAQRNNTTAEAIQAINNLPDSFLRVDQRLILP
jgi:LysM repeat protein